MHHERIRWGILLGASLLANTQAEVFHNQLGWPPTAFKTVVLSGTSASASGAWSLTRSADKAPVVTGTLPAAKLWAPMGTEPAKLIRLPDSLATGAYLLEIAGLPSVALRVDSAAWTPVSKGLLKGFYYTRAGIALEAKYAGPWARPAAFVTGYASYHPSTGRTTGGRNSPKGWFDAGDFNKYVVSSSMAEWNLLTLAENHPNFTKDLRWGIPEEGGNASELLAEARWNLEWMLSMQDDDGGVFHKWTQKQFGGYEMPDQDRSERFLVGKSANASYDFAAVMAMASRVWKTVDPRFSDTTLAAAKRAWAWANAHQSAIYRANPSDVATGQYEDSTCQDERLWASVELAVTTKDTEIYFPRHEWSSQKLPWWQNVGMLAAYTVVSHPEIFSPSDVSGARKSILDLAEVLARRVATNGWAAPQQDTGAPPHSYQAGTAGDFNWNSNSDLAHMGIHSLYAWQLTKDSAHLRAADAAMDHLMGRNPLGVCNVSGFGTKSYLHPHSRISESDGVQAPLPGLLTEGPYAGGNDIGNGCTEYRVPGKIALAFLDDKCSYATNEPVINGSAAAAHLATALAGIHAGSRPREWSGTLRAKPPVRRNRPDLKSSGRNIHLQEASQVRWRNLQGRVLWGTETQGAVSLDLPAMNGFRVVEIRSASSSDQASGIQVQ